MKKIFLFSFSLLVWNFFSTTSFAQNKNSTSKMLKIMTYNIHHGAPPQAKGSENKIDLDAIAEVIKSENPDIVALQEVDSMASRSNKQFQAKSLAEKSGMKYFYYADTRTFTESQGWGYGNAILSKYKLKDANTLFYPYYYHEGAENRVAAIATVELPDGKAFTFLSTHFDYQHQDVRLLEAATIRNLGEYTNIPVILAGDLNSNPNSEIVAHIKATFVQSCQTCGPTFPYNNPKTKLDYVMYSKNSPFRVKSSQIINNEATQYASDHLPYVVELIWKK